MSDTHSNAPEKLSDMPLEPLSDLACSTHQPGSVVECEGMLQQRSAGVQGGKCCTTEHAVISIRQPDASQRAGTVCFCQHLIGVVVSEAGHCRSTGDGILTSEPVIHVAEVRSDVVAVIHNTRVFEYAFVTVLVASGDAVCIFLLPQLAFRV